MTEPEPACAVCQALPFPCAAEVQCCARGACGPELEYVAATGLCNQADPAKWVCCALQVWAVDLSPTPVAYATFNSQRLGVPDRVRVVQGSWYEPLQQAGAGSLGGIVSNPPYVTAQQMPGLQAEVGR